MNGPRHNLPSVPWWVVIVGFICAAPVGVVLLIYKLVQESQPKQTNWYTQQFQQAREEQARQAAQAQNAPGQNAPGQGGPHVHAQAAPGQAAPHVHAQAAPGQRPPYPGQRPPYPGPQPSQAQPAYHRTAPPRRYPLVRLKSGTPWTITGAAIAGIFGLGAVSSLLDWLPFYSLDYVWYALQDAFIPGLFACGGLALIVWGRFRTNQSKKFRRYLARIGSEPLVPLRPLAESIPADLEEVCETLQEMIDYGVFGDRAYIDFASETLVLDSAVARPKAPEKPAEPKKAPPAAGKPSSAPEDRILREIRHANDLIPDEAVSAKIDRIEEITRHILTYLNKHPERSGELHTFLDYYLPTTLKMLHTYAELDDQQNAGQNVSVTKARIENILDKVVEGFELQLDKLFEGDMLDISADIDVMERMLQRDGLSGDFKLHQQAAGGYTPSLTLDPDGPGAEGGAL